MGNKTEFLQFGRHSAMLHRSLTNGVKVYLDGQEMLGMSYQSACLVAEARHEADEEALNAARFDYPLGFKIALVCAAILAGLMLYGGFVLWK